MIERIHYNFNGLFITGTDTEIGKTTVCLRILQQLAGESLSCVGMKPVASGAVQTYDGLRNDDAVKLQQASTVDVKYEWINPYCFKLPIAPHIAAQQENIEIKPASIQYAYKQLSTQAEIVLVEGVGGWSVPFSDTFSVAQLAQILNLPVVLVVGLRLGCINRALLSVESISHSQCRLAGWVANSLQQDYDFQQQTIETLQQKITAPLLGVLAWGDTPKKPIDLSKI